jgi:outer membrane receptor protein involved in Fe transport
MRAKRILSPLLLLAVTGGAMAQTAPSPAADATPPATEKATASADASTHNLGTVVVTARKKSEALQQVPMSVVALEYDELQEQGIDNLTDLAAAVPGLQQQDLAISSRLTLRGVNSGDNNAFEQSVGVYVDGLYRGRMNQQHIGLFDLERIEVLKGPQVTLYGNSSIGGAISAISRRPGFEAGGDVRVRYEFEYQEPHVEAGFDLPVNDQFALRLAGKWRDQQRGTFPNDYDHRSAPQYEEGAVRLSALWQPSDALELSLRHEDGRYQRNGHILDVYKHVDGQGNPWPNSYFTGLNDGRLNVGNGDPFKYQDSFLHSDMAETRFELHYQFENASLTAISGYSRYVYQQSLDVDLTPTTLVNVFQDERYRQFSQEIRLAGAAGERADYLIGLYYQDDHFRNDYLSDFNLPPLLAPLFGVTADVIAALIPPFDRHILLDQDTRQWALFGNVDVRFSERLTGTLGFRYLEIRKDGEQAVRPADLQHVDGAGPLVDIRWLDPQLGPLLLGNAAYLADPTHYVLVLPDDTEVAPVLAPAHVVGYALASAGNGVLHEFTGLSRREDHPMFHASLAWQQSPDLLLYATWSNGAKAGGFDFNYEGGDLDEVEYEPEQANVFEFGLKKDWRNLRLNVAAFYGQYDDLQVSVYDGGIGFLVGNAASSVSRGVDVDFLWQIARDWRLSGSLAWLDFHYDDFRDGNCSTTDRLNGSGPICDWTGERTPFVPEFESALALQHTWQFASGWTLQQELRWQYKGDHSTASDNEPQTHQGAYDLLDYRLDLSPDHARWGLSLIGRNLTDATYNVFTSVIPLAPGGAFANVRGKGRELALEWHWRF